MKISVVEAVCWWFSNTFWVRVIPVVHRPPKGNLINQNDLKSAHLSIFVLRTFLIPQRPEAGFGGTEKPRPFEGFWIV
jgi:hypothetical protein